MPHDPKFDADFRHYTATRDKALKLAREMRCYYQQVEQVLAAMPRDNRDAGYLDLDNVQQLAGDLDEAVDALDWDGLDMEFCRLGLPAEVTV